MISQLQLENFEVDQIGRILTDLCGKYSFAEDPEFLANAALYAHELPVRVRKYLNDYRLERTPHRVCIISGLPINDADIGPTPAHWRENIDRSNPLREELAVVLFSSLLGEPFGWQAEQGGRVVQDLIPVEGDATKQVGTGSALEIAWHTEEAFHPHCCDYLCLCCLRNPSGVPTTFASIDSIELPADIKSALFEARYPIRMSESHRQTAGEDEARPISIFFGNRESPYLRIDPYFMIDPTSDEVAHRSYKQLIEAIEQKIQDYVLRPGDICFIDNYKCVHGRRAFKAQFNRRDRWLKRLNITGDLRKSSAARKSLSSRLIANVCF